MQIHFSRLFSSFELEPEQKPTPIATQSMSGYDSYGESGTVTKRW